MNDYAEYRERRRATRRAGFVAKVARDGERHAAADPLEAGVADGWGGGVVFSRECALVEAACVPEGRVREWEHSRQRLAKALGALQLLQVPVSAYLRACRHVYLRRHSYTPTVSRILGTAPAPREK